MFLDVDLATGSCRLVEPNVFRSFYVESVSMNGPEVARAMAMAGRVAEEEDHVWVAIDWLVGQARGDDAWRAEFSRMLAYAKSKGWVNDEGTHIKAHLKLRST